MDPSKVGCPNRRLGDEIEVIEAAGVVELSLDRLQIGQRGLCMLLHHGRPCLLIQLPPLGILPDRNDDGIGLGIRVCLGFEPCLQLIGKAGHIVRLLRDPVKNPGVRQMLPERGVHQIDEKVLGFEHLCGMHPHEEIGLIG
jgi:hypothetical protein